MDFDITDFEYWSDYYSLVAAPPLGGTGTARLSSYPGDEVYDPTEKVYNIGWRMQGGEALRYDLETAGLTTEDYTPNSLKLVNGVDILGLLGLTYFTSFVINYIPGTFPFQIRIIPETGDTQTLTVTGPDSTTSRSLYGQSVTVATNTFTFESVASIFQIIIGYIEDAGDELEAVFSVTGLFIGTTPPAGPFWTNFNGQFEE